MNDTIERSQTHATFVIERSYAAPVETVWHALSDNDARDQWFGGGSTFDVEEKAHDFRVGGHGTEDGQWHGGPRSRFVSTYTVIVDLRRIVFTYDLWVDEQHMSTSLTTIALEPDGDQTRLTYTEQGVHFDGLDSVEGREEGTRGLLEQLASHLATGSR
ncbi:MAG TPA: SRPBCC family protein [Solirubrobacteraceae bacterium]